MCLTHFHFVSITFWTMSVTLVLTFPRSVLTVTTQKYSKKANLDRDNLHTSARGEMELNTYQRLFLFFFKGWCFICFCAFWCFVFCLLWLVVFWCVFWWFLFFCAFCWLLFCCTSWCFVLFCAFCWLAVFCAFWRFLFFCTFWWFIVFCTLWRDIFCPFFWVVFFCIFWRVIFFCTLWASVILDFSFVILMNFKTFFLPLTSSWFAWTESPEHSDACNCDSRSANKEENFSCFFLVVQLGYFAWTLLSRRWSSPMVDATRTFFFNPTPAGFTGAEKRPW